MAVGFNKTTYQVSKGAALMGKDGELIEAGTLLQADEEFIDIKGKKRPPVRRKSLYNSYVNGFVTVYEEGNDFGPDDLTPDVPGTTSGTPEMPALSAYGGKDNASGVNIKNETGSLRAESSSGMKIASLQKPQTRKAPVQSRSKWNLNPDDLRDTPLDQLNAMVSERDNEQDPFEDVEEARAFLSQDYNASLKVTRKARS